MHSDRGRERAPRSSISAGASDGASADGGLTSARRDRPRVIAVDWSGAAEQAQRTIWVAEVRDGLVERLESGRDRDAVAEFLLEEGARDPALVVGLDFAFSLPAWFLEGRGIADAPALWDLVAHEGERWLSMCAPPFWGRPGARRPDLPDHFRRADREVPRVGGIRPKSVFQIGGAGAVGTGSLRGMPVLRRLRDGGFSVWPFDAPRLPLVVEIYPRALTGAVVKSSPAARERYLDERYPALQPDIRRLAATSEDAFDALVSALVMVEHADEFIDLHADDDPQRRREGRIWLPRESTDIPLVEGAEPTAALAERRRSNDSSKTRVGPVFHALAEREPDEPQWLRRLLSLAEAGDPGGRQWEQMDLRVLERFYEPHERGLQPPVALLSWLIRHFEPPPERIEGDGEVAASRRRLAAGEPAAIEEALRLLRTAGAGRGWHVLEGPTYPDAFLVTPDALIVVEGKRTERSATTETTWMAGRHQILRHLDAAWEIRGRRAVFGLLIVEGDFGTGAVPELWRRAAEDTVTSRAIQASLPHRGAEEQQRIARAFVGVTTWQRVLDEFRLENDLLAQSVPHAARPLATSGVKRQHTT